MSNIKYTKEHEWVSIEGDTAALGITEYAQNALGDLVYVELPETGQKIEQDQDFAVVESVKVASEIYSPFSGEITEVNEILSDDPEALKGALETSWIIKMKLDDPSQIDDLMDEAEYNEFIKDLD